VGEDRILEIMRRMGIGLRALADRVPKVLDDPQAYPQEAMLLAALVALAIILIMLGGLLVSSAIRQAIDKRRMGVRRRWDAGLRALAMGVVIVAGVTIVFSTLPAVTQVGSACGQCHEIEPAVEAWKVDVHSSVSCYGCHARTGPLGYVQAGLTGVSRLLSSRGTTAGAIPQVFEARCTGCHDDIAVGVTTGPIAMRHSDVIDAGYGCLPCHDGVGHVAMAREEDPISRSRMSKCLGCHDGEQAPSGCMVCHESRPSDTQAQVPGATTETGITCEGCHSEQVSARCIDCHGLELPHPVTFRGEHARMSSQNPPLCVRCHEQAGPNQPCDCHYETNVHGTYNAWFPQHGPYATTNYPGGCMCHENTFCAMCHPNRY
jgi:hypothetical protein